MPCPNIPSDARGYYEFAKGADAFYRGRARPRIDPFATLSYGFRERDGWDWAEWMFTAGANYEARHATRH